MAPESGTSCKPTEAHSSSDNLWIKFYSLSQKKATRFDNSFFSQKERKCGHILYTCKSIFFPFLGHKKLLLSSPRSLPNTGLMMPTKGRHRRSRSSVMGASKLTHNMRSNRTFFSDTSLPEPICEPCSTSCSFYVSAEIFPCEDDGWWLLLTELVIAALSRCCITTIQPLPEEKLGCLKDAPDILEKEKPLARATCPHKVKLVKTFVVGKCD